VKDSLERHCPEYRDLSLSPTAAADTIASEKMTTFLRDARYAVKALMSMRGGAATSARTRRRMKAAKASLTDAPCTKVLTRWILACAATVSLAAGVGAGTQAPPSFAGHWVVTSISPQRPVYDQFWFGTEALVTQTETRLVITRMNPPPRREAQFTFGGESRNEYIVNGQKLVRDSRATLSHDTLLISTDTTPPDGERWLSNILRWSLDRDGTLVVGDTEICGKGECPSVVTTLKFKKH
jgi:hypothetical protein